MFSSAVETPLIEAKLAPITKIAIQILWRLICVGFRAGERVYIKSCKWRNLFKWTLSLSIEQPSLEKHSSAQRSFVHTDWLGRYRSFICAADINIKLSAYLWPLISHFVWPDFISLVFIWLKTLIMLYLCACSSRLLHAIASDPCNRSLIAPTSALSYIDRDDNIELIIFNLFFDIRQISLIHSVPWISTKLGLCFLRCFQ